MMDEDYEEHDESFEATRRGTGSAGTHQAHNCSCHDHQLHKCFVHPCHTDPQFLTGLFTTYSMQIIEPVILIS